MRDWDETAVRADPAEEGPRLERFGGHLRCTVCGREQPLGDTTSHLRNGWPMCCSYTMRWLTQRELDAEAKARLIDGDPRG